jgi:hypothetical protein
MEPSYKWMWTRYGAYAKQLRVTVHPLASDPGGCEVTAHADLRWGLKANSWGAAGTTVGFGTGGGAVGLAIGAQALELVGAALALPAAAGAGLLALVSLGGYRVLYKHGLRRTVKELERALAAIELDLRSEELFGSTPQTAPALPPRGADGAGGMGVLFGG